MTLKCLRIHRDHRHPGNLTMQQWVSEWKQRCTKTNSANNSPVSVSSWRTGPGSCHTSCPQSFSGTAHSPHSSRPKWQDRVLFRHSFPIQIWYCIMQSTYTGENNSLPQQAPKFQQRDQLRRALCPCPWRPGNIGHTPVKKRLVNDLIRNKQLYYFKSAIAVDRKG